MNSPQLLDIGLVIALSGVITQVLKGLIPVRFIALIPVVIGTSLGLLLMGPSVENGIMGLILGLSACGLYDQKRAFSSKKIG